MVRSRPIVHRLVGTVTTVVFLAGRTVVMVVLVVVMVLRFGLNGWALGGLAAAMIVMIMPQRGYRIGKQIARQHQPTRKFLHTTHCRDLTNRKTRTFHTILRGRSLESNLPRQRIRP